MAAIFHRNQVCVYCIKISVRVLATHSTLSPHVRKSGIWQIFAVGILNPQWFGIRNPLWYGIRNPESWNPESKGLESRIQRPGSGIQDLRGFSYMGRSITANGNFSSTFRCVWIRIFWVKWLSENTFEDQSLRLNSLPLHSAFSGSINTLHFSL